MFDQASACTSEAEGLHTSDPFSDVRPPRAGRKLNILVICNYEPHQAATIQDHIKALHGYSAHNVCVYSGIGEFPQHLSLDRFDAIICHYSIAIASDAYLGPISRFRIRKFRGLKALFIQDEYRHVNATIDAIDYLGIDVIFTCVEEQEWAKVYPTARLPKLVRVNVLTGYVPEHLVHRRVPSTADRPIDVGYRGRRYPAWHGALGRARVAIAEQFARFAVPAGLVCDVAVDEAVRLYGQSWIDFLSRCKAVLGTESGSSVFDFTGEIAHAVKEHCYRHPDASYEELRALYFQHEEDRIRLNQISSRCFEAIALRTLLILYEGEYSGVIEPGKHYVPLRKDHSNMGEVIETIRNARRVEQMIENAYADVAMNPAFSYRNFVARVDTNLVDLAPCSGRTLPPYSQEEFTATFGEFTTPFRPHLIKSRVIASTAMFVRERIAPVLGGRQAALIGRCMRAAGNAARRWQRRWKLSRLVGTIDDSRPLKSTLSPAEYSEFRQLSFRCRIAAEIARSIGQPTLTVRLDPGVGVVSITPDSEPFDAGTSKVDALEFASELRRLGGAYRFLWVPGSHQGLCGPMHAHKAEELVHISKILQSKPELLPILFCPSSTVFAFTSATGP